MKNVHITVFLVSGVSTDIFCENINIAPKMIHLCNVHLSKPSKSSNRRSTACSLFGRGIGDQ